MGKDWEFTDDLIQQMSNFQVGEKDYKAKPYQDIFQVDKGLLGKCLSMTREESEAEWDKRWGAKVKDAHEQAQITEYLKDAELRRRQAMS